MKKILQAASAAVLSVSLGAGVVSAAQSSTVSVGETGGTGRNSTVNVDSSNRDSRKVNNRANLNLMNANVQGAQSGRSVVRDNRTGGDATTGTATNDTLLNVGATVNNSAANAAAQEGAGSGATNGVTVGATGRNSTVNVDAHNSTRVTTNNKTNVNIGNTNAQAATSGNARVSDNNTGGSAQTGNVQNMNTTTVTLNVTN